MPSIRAYSQLRLLAVFLAAWRNATAFAGPQGMSVVSGAATAQQNGSHLNITTSPFVVLNWSSFNIQAGETTSFLQPSVNSVVFNNIGGASPSQIFGNLNANGTVILANANGIYFGPNSMVKVGGTFIATTAALPPDLGAGSSWQFTGTPPLASIVNYGQVSVGKGQSLYLIAENIENHGSLSAPGGQAALLAGQSVLVSDRPDGRGLSAQVTLPAGSVDNSGRIVADAGSVLLNAQVVNQNGVIQANSIKEHDGVIELDASSALTLGPDSQIVAQGDSGAQPSSGGSVTLKSGNTFADSTGSQIITIGGAAGGNGGNVEISAPNILSLNSTMNAGALAGWTGGQLLLDPVNITLGTSGTGSAGNGTVAWNSGSGTLALNVTTAFANKNFSSIDLQASGNITLAAGTTWNLSASTGVQTGNLMLQAGGNIIFGNNSVILDPNNWSVNLQAGVNFTSGSVQSGTGSIYLNGGTGLTGSGAIQTAQGSISLTAGQDIQVGTGFINTFGGGNITVDALAGSVNAGNNNNNYQFGSAGYSIASTANGYPQVGGISAVRGGDVTIEAGQNVVSIPVVPLGKTPGASGAYGSQPGNVTVIAGNQILGNYLVRNGTGLLEAGVTVQDGAVTQVSNPSASVGSSTQPVSLSLVSGNWGVFAGDNVYLAEVRNPNGVFNSSLMTVPANEYAGNESSSGVITPVPTRQSFLFDYSPDAGASIWAGNSIILGSANLPRTTSGLGDLDMPPIYPPQLSLTAGAGGITIENSLVLFPSSQGSLSITTQNGGNLSGVFLPISGGGLSGITMSDSGLPSYETFAAGHAATPLYENNSKSVEIDVSGQIENFSLTVPTAAAISAASAYNFSFSGQNVSPGAVTSINIAGDIIYRGDVTTVSLSDALPAELLNPSLSPNAQAEQAVLNLIANPGAQTLSFIGAMTAAEKTYLLNPTVLVFNPDGSPALDATGAQQTVPVVLTAAQQAAIASLYTASQTATLGDAGGINLNGPGKFSITANNLDLGISGGINVNPVPLPELTQITPLGAALNINLTGNLEMSATKIVNAGLAGGIDLQVNGTVDVGSQAGVFGDPNAARGIYTAGGGNISVNSGGDINVDGSRIAAFNGGNLDIVSQHGDVNAGSGGNGSVSIAAVVQLDSQGNLESFPATIYGSGIMATTPGGSTVSVGNITVQTPQGSINASAGGIEQVAFNQQVNPTGFIELDAGQNIAAGNSGVIGANIRTTAGGAVSGVFVGSGNVTINAGNNFSGTVVGSSAVAVTAGGTISGTIVGGESVAVSGSSITGTIVSGSVSSSGDISTASVGVPASNAGKEDARIGDDVTSAANATTATSSDDDEKKKKGQTIALRQKNGRVTMILPDKK